MTEDSPSGKRHGSWPVDARASAAEYLEAVKTGKAVILPGAEAEAARKLHVKLATMILDGADPMNIAREIIDTERRRRWREEQKILSVCFWGIMRLHSGNILETAKAFDIFAQIVKDIRKEMGPVRGRGETRDKAPINERLRAARARTQPGQIENAIAEAAEAPGLDERQSALRQARRLAKRRKDAAKETAESLEMLSKLWCAGGADADFAQGIIQWHQRRRRRRRPDK